MEFIVIENFSSALEESNAARRAHTKKKIPDLVHDRDWDKNRHFFDKPVRRRSSLRFAKDDNKITKKRLANDWGHSEKRGTARVLNKSASVRSAYKKALAAGDKKKAKDAKNWISDRVARRKAIKARAKKP